MRAFESKIIIKEGNDANHCPKSYIRAQKLEYTSIYSSGMYFSNFSVSWHLLDCSACRGWEIGEGHLRMIVRTSNANHNGKCCKTRAELIRDFWDFVTLPYFLSRFLIQPNVFSVTICSGMKSYSSIPQQSQFHIKCDLWGSANSSMNNLGVSKIISQSYDGAWNMRG